MPISVRCQCGQRFNAKDELAGKTVKCPKCAQPLKIPRPEPEPAPAPADDLLLEPVTNSSWMDDLLGGAPPAAPAPAMGAAPLGKPAAALTKSANGLGASAASPKAGGLANSQVANPQAAKAPATKGLGPAGPVAGKAPSQAWAPMPQQPVGPTKEELEKDARTTKMLLIGGGIGGALVLLVLGGLIGYQMMADEGSPKAAPVDPRVAAAFGEQAPGTEAKPAGADSDATASANTTAADTSNSATGNSDAADDSAAQSGDADSPAPKSSATDEELADILKEVRDETPPKPVKLAVDDSVVAEMKQAFDALGEALKSGGEHEVAASFDFERVRKEAQRLGNIHVPDEHRQEAMKRFAPSIAESLTSQSRSLAWNSYEIRRIDLSEDGTEAEVLVRHNQLQDRTAKMRWWMVKEGDRWRFYDFEHLLFGIPFSTSVIFVAGDPADVQKLMEKHEAFESMSNALRASNMNALGNALDVLDSFKLDEDDEAIKQFVRGLWYLRRGEPQQALRAFDRSEKAHGDMPALMIERAEAHIGLGDGKRGLEYVREYEKRLGRDDESWRQIGRALIALGRTEDGLAAYRRGLAYNPKSVYVLYEMAIALPKSRRSEMAKYLRPTIVGPNVPGYVAGQLQEHGHEEMLQVVFDIMQKNEANPNEEMTADETFAEDEPASQSAETTDETTDDPAEKPADTSAASDDPSPAKKPDKKPAKPAEDGEFDPFSE